MTEVEAKGFVQGKLDCMNKCDIFNKEDNISDNDCDNCEYCYSQGNFGNQKEAFQIAINALEKQIPKKPKCIDKETETFDCPCCGHTIIALDDMTIHNNCLMCGQKLDWSDEDNEG